MQNFSRLERIAAAIYFIWFSMHLGLFFYSTESSDNSLFWPFYPGDKTIQTTYDVTEFIVFIASPLIIFIAYRIVYGRDYESSSGNRRHSAASFFIAFLDEKIKGEELSQKINELQNRTVNYDYLAELKSDREKAASHSVNDWLNKIEVKKKYKEYEN